MYRQITTSAEQKVIGVSNGIYQVEIDIKSLKKNNNYNQIETLISEIDVFKFLGSQTAIIDAKIKYVRGNLLPKAKLTDIMGFTPFIFGFKYIVSQRFVDCLIEELVDSSEFHLQKIEIVESDMDYYLFFVPMIPLNDIVFSKSLLFPERELLSQKRSYYLMKNHEDYNEILKTNLFNRWERIVLNERYREKNIINLQVESDPFFSEKLINRFKEAGITNCIANSKITLTFGSP